MVDRQAGSNSVRKAFAQLGRSPATHVQDRHSDSPGQAHGVVRRVASIVVHAGMGSALKSPVLRRPIVLLGSAGRTVQRPPIGQCGSLDGRGGTFLASAKDEPVALLDQHQDLRGGEQIGAYTAGEVVMLCTARRGGMRAVVEGYRDDGLFERYRIRWLQTNCEGPLWKRLGVAAAAYMRLCRMLLQRRVSALHSHMAMRGSFWRKSVFNATARAFGVPVIAHLHGSEFKDFYACQPGWRQRLIAREFERCERVLALSDSWVKFVRDIAPRARVVELPNYVRMPVLTAMPPSPEESINVLFLGAVGERKGIYDLLPAFARALEAIPQMKLSIGGNGEIDRARVLARTLAIDGKVEFLGWISGGAKATALRAAHIYILPSHNEGLPVSILEAMSYGVPVIATRVGGIPELFRDGQDGVLVDAGDVSALADALVRLASSASMRTMVGNAGRSRVATHFSDTVVLPRLSDIYGELLSRAHGQEMRPESDS